MNVSLLVSIVVDNYNYGHYLRNAIDSALHQSYRPLEVIVVDDGSTDDSRVIISQYGNRIIPIFKENGGQASALNAGFARSQGDIVIFLDADDCLLPDLVDRVVHMVRQHPRLAHVVYRLALVDAEGSPNGGTIPPRYLSLPAEPWGANRFQAIMNSGSWAPTSGNAFAASALRQFMPIPEEPFRFSADYYLCRLSALVGPVASLPTIGGFYRIHEKNTYHRSKLDLHEIRAQIHFVRHAHHHLREAARALDVEVDQGQILDEIHLAHRLISRKLDPRRHPLPEDTPFALGRLGIAASRRRPDLPLLQKAIHSFWFAAMLASPMPLARALAHNFFSGSRQTLNRFLATAARASSSREEVQRVDQ